MRKHGLELQKLVAIETDNTPVMIGINNSIYAKFKKEVPGLILMCCICHSLKLAVSHAINKNLPKKLEFYFKETFNWFSHSATRHSKYKKLYSSMNDGSGLLKLIQFKEICWMPIHAAIERILKQWHELKEHFNLARMHERCYTE